MQHISIVDTNDILLLVVYYPPVKEVEEVEEVELDPLEDKFVGAEEVVGQVEVDEESHFQFLEKITSYYGRYISISKGN